MKKTFIDKKYQELQKLNLESDNALDVVTRTIDRLDSINTQIVTVVNEIEDAEQRLNDTKAGLNQTKERNLKIMQRFKELIGE